MSGAEAGTARARAWYATGCGETERGEFAAAAGSFERALEAAPDWPEAQHNLGRALFELGRVDDAVRCFEAATLGPHPGLPRAMMAVVIPGSDAADHGAVLAARRAWAQEFLPPLRPGPAPRARAPNDALRVGYVSSFFHRPNWMKPVWALINAHDRRAVEVHLFADSPGWTGGDDYRAHSGDGIHSIAQMSNEEAAAVIERCAIDVLVDLNAYSRPARLPLYQWRPAPVVASWFNMYATSGMPCFDYVVGDGAVVSPNEERFYCERVVRVDGSYLTFTPWSAAPDVAPAPCATSGAITFGCLASQYKITPAVMETWGRILQRAQGSTLILRNAALASAGVRRYVHDALAANGVARDRVRILGPADHREFIGTYDAIDVALDTFPYSGGTTTMEAIWQGVPVVTFHGDRWASRTSESILRAAGLSEFVAADRDGYVALALALAAAPDQVAQARRAMRERVRASDACNGDRLARAMERLYRRMHEERTRGHAADGSAVR
ncbi:MAG TPA: tetratricopeptide repeat protein [Gemmatimonadaceae bacterium]|jgi:predicted O-linked N-acetylglucosamine transferase (SPINDLY family)